MIKARYSADRGKHLVERESKRKRKGQVLFAIGFWVIVILGSIPMILWLCHPVFIVRPWRILIGGCLITFLLGGMYGWYKFIEKKFPEVKD